MDFVNKIRPFHLYIFSLPVLLTSASPFAYAAEAGKPAASPPLQAGQQILAASSQSSQAADPGKSSGDVIVTAQRRSEAVSKVPASITAISGETIARFSIETFADYAKLVPNLAFGYGVGGTAGVTGARSAVIRGITGANTTSFYINDTPLPQSLDPRLFNLDHIEVLRGPQGTLFGASSMGGTVRVITKSPSGDTVTGDFDAKGFVTNHAPGVGSEVSGVVNSPIVKDQLTLSVSGYVNHSPGYFTRTYNDPAAVNATSGTRFSIPVTGPAAVVNNVGGFHDAGVAAAIEVKPEAVPGLTVNAMTMYQNKTTKGFPLADYSADNLVQRRVLNVPEFSRDSFSFSALTVSYQTGVGRLVSSTSLFNRDFFDREDGTDANVGAFSYLYSTYPQGPFALYPKTGDLTQGANVVTQEVRFESEFNIPIQLVAGLFYQRTTNHYNGQNIAQGFGQGATGGVYPDNIYSFLATAKETDKAAFVGFTYAPVKALELQAGVRYTDVGTDFTSTNSGIYGSPGVVVRQVSADKPVTPRFSAKYTVSPSTIIYATAAQGFRAGGANSPLSNACAGLTPYTTGQPIPYGSDKLWSYEAGVKTKAMNNRLSFSGSVYHIDWTGIQQYVVFFQGACYAPLTVNLGSAVSQGGELEGGFAVSRELSINGFVGYDDAKITDPGANSTFRKNQPLSSVPKWTAGASMNYERDMSFGSMFLRGKFAYTGDSMSYTQNPAGLVRPAYSTTDIRGGVKIDHITASLYIDNLFDARTNLSDEAPRTSIVPGRYRYFVGRPRTIGAEVKYSF